MIISISPWGNLGNRVTKSVAARTLGRLVGAWIVAVALMMPVSAAWACSDQTKPIAVGGVDGFQSFANPANTAILRASCKVSLYIHDYIWIGEGGVPARPLVR